MEHQLFDIHIHVGQYREIYTTPKEVADTLDSIGVSSYAVSSISSCEGDYAKILDEMSTLSELAGDKLFAALWVLPKMFSDGGLKLMRESGIRWRLIKVHPQLQPDIWNSREYRDKVMALAQEMNLPVLIHTGEWEGCYPLEYEDTLVKYPSVTVILAHGRPIDQTITLMKKYPNVWCDTAFMLTENIVKLCNENLTDRVLWGSDYPINRWYYRDLDSKDWYLDLVKKLRESVCDSDFEKITRGNFEGLFCL